MRASDPGPRPEIETQQSTTRARDVRSDGEAIGTARAEMAPTSDRPSLVPPEAIGPETDIRAFLAAGVPSELTRAALRRAWRSDPNIRDFVGLADYDWDFNTPGSMTGFGVLEASEHIERELAHLVRAAAAVTASETPVSRRQPANSGPTMRIIPPRRVNPATWLSSTCGAHPMSPNPKITRRSFCEWVSGLARWKWPAPPDAERALFEAHLVPWIGHFFADLERTERAQFYRSVGALGRVYMEVEAEAFALPA
jgi:hypothetical protein